MLPFYPTSMLLSIGGGRTYEEFVAHVTLLASAGSRGWDQSLNGTGKRLTTASAPTGTMIGSSWGPSSPNGVWDSSAVARAIQHAMADEAIFGEAVANSAVIYFDTTARSTVAADLPSVNRNGFTSSASNRSAQRQITDLLRFDFATGRVFRSNPSLGTAEAEYTWSA